MRNLAFFLALTAFLLGSCRPEPDKVMDGTPEITFASVDTTILEIEEGETRDFEYVFENTGTATLMLLDVDVACGCTLTSWAYRPVEPGEKGVLKVHYDSSRLRGVRRNFIDVFTNGNYVRLFFTTEVI